MNYLKGNLGASMCALKDAVAQAAVGHEEKDAEDRVATAEDEVEEALQAVLDAECTGGDGSEGAGRLTAHMHAFISGVCG